MTLTEDDVRRIIREEIKGAFKTLADAARDCDHSETDTIESLAYTAIHTAVHRAIWDLPELPSEETQQKIPGDIDLDDEEDADPAYCESGPSIRNECGNPAEFTVWISRPDGTTGIPLHQCTACADWLASRFQGDPTRTVHRTPIAKDTP